MAVEPSAKEKAVSWCHEKTRNDVVMENIGLVYLVLKRFQDRGYETEELFQIGTEGLIKAVERFDPGKGFAFSTYAVPMIMGEIRRFLRDDGMVHIGRRVKQNAGMIMEYRERCQKEGREEPTISEIERETGLSKEDILNAMEAPFGWESLSAPVGAVGVFGGGLGSGVCGETEGLVLGDTIADGAGTEQKALERVLVAQLLQELNGEERKLIYLRYHQELTQTQIAEAMNMNQVAVSRMEKKIMDRLRGVCYN